MMRSGKLCASFFYKWLTAENQIEIENETDSGKKLIKKGDMLKCLTETFQSYGGVLAKLSQIICTEDQNSHVFSDCKPFSQGKTIEYIKDLYADNKDFFKNVISIDFNVFKSGSFGQVHKAIYKNKNNELKDIVIKVQYVNLREQAKSDLFILDNVATYLFRLSNLTNAMVDIKTKLNEELDYRIELSNQQMICDIWKNNKSIKIPELIPALCTDKILAMHYINAEPLSEFINNSTQEERNVVGNSIVEFIFTTMFKHKIFYSDIHYGNFLVKNKKTLYVMDFGCLHFIDNVLLENLKCLYKSVLNDNTDEFYFIVEEMGITNESTSQKSKDYMWEYFKLQLTPWTSEEFEFTDDWLTQSVYKNVDLMKEWQLPSKIVYINKIPFGAYHLFTKLKLKGSFLNYFNDIMTL